MFKKIILWILVILNCFIIFHFSSELGRDSNKKSELITQKVENIVTDITAKEESETHFGELNKFIRKQGHFIEFAFLGVFLFLLVRCYDFSVKKCFLITLLFVFFYACTDEAHQLFVDGRNGNIKDVFIDFLGGVTGAVLVLLKRVKKQTKKL